MPSKDSDQPAHWRSLIRILTGHSLNSQECKAFSCKQWRLWSDGADAPANWSLRWALSEGTFSHTETHILFTENALADIRQNVTQGSPSRKHAYIILTPLNPASVAQLDAPSDWRPGGRGFNPRRGRQHSFVEIDQEIFSTVILSLPLIQEGQLSVSGEKMCTILVNRLED